MEAKRRMRKKTVIRVDRVVKSIENNLAMDFLKGRISDKKLAQSLQRVKRAGRTLNKIAKTTVEPVAKEVKI